MRTAHWFKLVVMSGVVWIGVACEDQGPATVASVNVTSPIGGRLAVGRTVQLAAEPRDAGSAALAVPVTWSTSAPNIANVSTTGAVTGVAAGNATISAAAGGVTGQFTVQVLAVDFGSMTTALTDQFLGALSQALSAAVRSRVLVSQAQCATGITQGNFGTIEACITAGRAEVTAATDPTDQALLSSVALYLDHVQRLLVP